MFSINRDHSNALWLIPADNVSYALWSIPTDNVFNESRSGVIYGNDT